ncbi:MAG TPA: ATP-binding cassette domain-containing protein [Acidimicrobiales bacterium]|jgi:ABC-2 type transport system ATP-binding protein|nr:ATP-binding cassette domain-containing protein [Acidimicrobiales bacterium]
MTYTVVARGLTKVYGGAAALAGVDLDVATGTIVALLGPNGAGKTTMIRILATLTRPDGGTAVVAGHDLMADPKAIKRDVSLTGQYAAVDDLLTGEENLLMMARLRHVPRAHLHRRVQDMLTEFDLVPVRDRRVAGYSGGLRRRLDLAMSMIVPPKLLFLDEPTTGLDPRSREQLWETVRRLVGGGVTVLLTTQYLEEADQLADTIVMIDHGRVVSQGRAAELKARVGTEVIRLEFAARPDYERAVRQPGVIRADEGDRVIEVATDGSAAHVQHELARLTVGSTGPVRVAIDRPTLDDVFLSVTEAVA